MCTSDDPAVTRISRERSGVGENAEDLIKEVEELKQVLKDHSRQWNHNPRSYAAMCTVVYAPKFCSLYHHHHHHYICKINKLHKEYTRYYVK